jgi:hypothetical protein
MNEPDAINAAPGPMRQGSAHIKPADDGRGYLSDRFEPGVESVSLPARAFPRRKLESGNTRSGSPSFSREHADHLRHLVSVNSATRNSEFGMERMSWSAKTQCVRRKK